MTATDLSTYAAILLSLVCSYVPGIKDAFELLSSVYKRLVMLCLLVIITMGIIALACWKVSAGEVPVTCDAAGAAALVKALIAAIIANQATYLISPKTSKLVAQNVNARRIK